jgi:RimJ/RimL family protein N-acetyltransferase
VRLRGERVVIRRIRLDELEEVRARWNGLSPEVAPNGAPDPERMRERIERSDRIRDGWIDLAVEIDGQLAGGIQTYQTIPPLPPGTFEVGISLYDAGLRGRGYGTEALGLFTAWLFDEQGAEVVQGSTRPGNAAMRRAFEKLGFTGSERIDPQGNRGVLYRVTRREWSRRRERPGAPAPDRP